MIPLMFASWAMNYYSRLLFTKLDEVVNSCVAIQHYNKYPGYSATNIAQAILRDIMSDGSSVNLNTQANYTSITSDGPNEKIQAVIDVGVCRRLVELLVNPQYKIITPALRTVGSICTGDDVQTQVRV